MKTFTNEGWITTRQACELLAISPRVLARLVREGRIHHGKEGGRLRFCLSDLRRVAEDEQVKRSLTTSRWFGEVHSERTRTALQQKKAQGVQLGAPALKDEATIARAVALKAEGLTLRQVAEQLTADGFKTLKGGKWEAMTVKRLLARAGA